MKTLLFGLFGLIATIYLVDSLKCNKCSVGVVGICIIGSEETCTGNDTVCYTGKATFPSISSFKGFNTQGCLTKSNCNDTKSGSILGAAYEVSYTCCETDKCNPVVSGASSTYISTSVALATALVASVWSSGIF